jgi:hypothetical protein
VWKLLWIDDDESLRGQPGKCLRKRKNDGTSRALRIGRAMRLVQGIQERMYIEHAVLDERRNNLDNRAAKVFGHQCQQVFMLWKKSASSVGA